MIIFAYVTKFFANETNPYASTPTLLVILGAKYRLIKQFKATEIKLINIV